MNIHETLIAARKIQEQGHVKGSLSNRGQTMFCMRGSILVAMQGSAYANCNIEELNRIEEAVCDANGWPTYFRGSCNQEIPRRNNSHWTTLDDVLGWFDRAIAYTAPHDDPVPEVVAKDSHNYSLT